MTDYRGQANHSLYLGRVVLDAWREGLARQDTPAAVLAEAFEPAACDHLVNAYGWFLLHIARPEPAPAVPPRGCAELPPPAEGKVEAGEIREFRQLEQGWLGDLLLDRRGPVERRRTPASLAETAPADPARVQQWADRLEELFERMLDSLDEY
jgi:hypothetical protein